MAPPAPTSPLTYDHTKLSSYSYAELRALCKSAGVSAGGKAAELRTRLAQVHGEDEAPTTSDSPPTVAPAVSDLAAKALATPLPSRQKTLPRIKTARPRQPPRSRLSWLLVSIAKFLLLLAAIMYAIDTYACRMEAFTSLGPIAERSCEVASTAKREVALIGARVLELSPVDLKTLDIKHMLIKGVDDAHASLLDKIEGKTKVPFEPLNRAVLDTLIMYNTDLGSVVANLEDVWSGRHVSSDDKANAVVFACLGAEDCTEVEADISAVADSKSVLKVLADESTTRAELQTYIASFLKDVPNGVVVVPRVERWSPALLSVLNNCMGEGGSLLQDGVAVPTNSATWLLTARVDITSDMAMSSVKLSLGVKKSLMDGLDETDETVQAVLMAFRRRLDVVALGTWVL